MPSAVKKSSDKRGQDTEIDPLKQIVQTLEKKIKGLENKKAKLDSFRTHPSTLTPVERDALARYGEVIACIEQAKEFQEQFTEIFQKADRHVKAKQKADRNERAKEETTRYQEILRLQSLLDTLGVEEIREDFLKEQKGAILLTDADLKQLDEFYQIINPSRDGGKDYKEQLASAASHLSNFLFGKDKAIAGTTYRKLKDLTKRIASCRYFAPKEKQEPEATESASAENISPEESVQGKGEDSKEEDEVKVHEPSVTPQLESLRNSEDRTTAAQALLAVGEADRAVVQDVTLTNDMPVRQSLVGPHQEVTSNLMFTDPASHEESCLQKPAGKVSFLPPCADGPARPINEVLASFEGNFEFLQDSEVDGEYNLGNLKDSALMGARAIENLHGVSFGNVYPSANAYLPDSGVSFGVSAYPEQSDMQTLMDASQTSQDLLRAAQQVSTINAFRADPAPNATLSDQVGFMHGNSTEVTQEPYMATTHASVAATSEDSNEWNKTTYFISNNWKEMGGQPSWGEESQWADEPESDGPPPIPMPGHALASSYKGGKTLERNLPEYDRKNDIDGFDGGNDQFMTVSYHSRNSNRGPRRGNRGRGADNNMPRSQANRNYDRNDRSNYNRGDRGNFDRNGNQDADRGNFERVDRERNDRGYYSRGGNNYNSYKGPRGGRRGGRNDGTANTNFPIKQNNQS